METGMGCCLPLLKSDKLGDSRERLDAQGLAPICHIANVTYLLITDYLMSAIPTLD